MATYLGVLLGLAWKAAVVFAVVWLAIAFLLRYSSLAALIATLAVPIVLIFTGRTDLAIVFAVMSAITWIKAPCQYRSPRRRHRIAHRIKRVTNTRPRLSDRQRVAWLRLIRTPNVGPATFRDLINRFGSAEAAIEQLPELMRNAGSGASPRIPPPAAAEAEIEKAYRHGARFVGIGEPDYPAQLRRMDYPPPLIAVKGNGVVFRLPAVAIVGARNASLAGMKMARMLAGAVAKEGYAVISGLARGIDTAAHEGSLATGTVAVMAGGLDRVYPPENSGLCERMAEAGAVVSEMPFGWEPRAQDFPRRNRIVAGLALGLVVVEAARTIRLADQRPARR